jgi:hypothetical protein
MLYQNDGDVNPSSSIPPAQSSSIYDTGFKDKIGEVKNRITNIGETLKELELGAERVSETFGFAGDKVRNMEISIGKSATGLLEVSKNAMTYEAALKRASEIVVEVSNATKRSFVASAEVIKGLETTSQATGVSTKDLAANFSEVGFQLTDVQDQMKTAANVAQKLGVNVGAVAAGVSANLNKLNQYNFQNGVEGLAKMVAKSAVLGVNMEDVFKIAEKAFDPEQAIDLAANLQRLGVTTSDLLDPLKVMDLGQNNPEELMNQMVNVTKGLTKIDETSGKVSILPGEMGRMRELANAMGMPLQKFTEMTIKSAELENKMKKISFPEMKVPMTEEDREMIANIAQFDKKSGEYKVKFIDEKGDEKEVAVNKLAPEDVELLKKQAQPKSMEEYAKDQLTVGQKMLKQLEYIASAGRAGVTQSAGGRDYRASTDKLMQESMNATFKKDKKDKDLHDISKETLGDIGNAMAEIPTRIAGDLVKGLQEGDITKVMTTLEGLGPQFETIAGKMSTKLPEMTKETMNSVGNTLQAASDEIKRKRAERLGGTTSSSAGGGTSAGAGTTSGSGSGAGGASSMNWHETLDQTMEQMRSTMQSPATITTPENKTPEQIQQEKNEEEFKAMEELLTASLEKSESPAVNMGPVIDSDITQTDRIVDRLDMLIEVSKENNFEIDYSKFNSNPVDENYLAVFEPLMSKFDSLITSQEKLLGVKSLEPTTIEKKELKESSSESELTKVEVSEVKQMLTPEQAATQTSEGLDKVYEVAPTELSKQPITELTPNTTKSESNLDVGGQITIVVEVRGVPNEFSRYVTDEVKRMVGNGEFTDAIYTQIKNKENGYGQLQGKPYSTPPGFG